MPGAASGKAAAGKAEGPPLGGPSDATRNLVAGALQPDYLQTYLPTYLAVGGFAGAGAAGRAAGAGDVVVRVVVLDEVSLAYLNAGSALS